MGTTRLRLVRTGDQPIQDLLLRTGRELRAVEIELAPIEAFVSDQIHGSSGTSKVPIADLQQLDLIRQKLLGIATFIESLAERSHESWHVDANSASRSLTLHGLALCLTGDGVARSSLAVEDSSPYELFDDN